MKKLCLISNTASHYRAPIYKLIDETFDTTFYFSEPFENLKLMDYHLLRKPVTELKTWHWHNFSFQHGASATLSKQFDYYITLGDVRSLSTWLFLLRAKVRHKKVFVWTHGWYGKESRLESFIKRFFYKLPTGVLLYGNYSMRLMIKEGIYAKKLFVVHNSLDYEKQLQLRNTIKPSDIYKSHFRNDNQTIIIICRLNARKRIDMLIDALDILKRKGSSYNLVIVGEGSEKDQLQNQVHMKGLEDQVWFYGACYDEKENAELIYNSDVCVTPGDVGLTAIHTMMFGVPVITHNHFPSQGPEFETIHEGVTGQFYQYEDVKSLADTIEEWLSLKIGIRDEVRQACYHEIDTQWTPAFQIKVIKTALQ